jgi:hypothetical protein
VRSSRSYRAVRPYTLAGDAEMSVTDRREVEKIYAGRDWRALVRGYRPSGNVGAICVVFKQMPNWT